MSDEFFTSEDFEQYDDAEELRRLIRAVKLSQQHFLYFVCCNQVPKQNELIAAVQKQFKGKKIRVVNFKKPITDLLGELQKKRIAHDCEAVFVQGLERSISSDGKGAENALIYNLNISRDSFKRYLACPLFLWLPEYAIVKITRHAPDFFSVRSGIFYFSNPSEQVTEQIFQNVSSNFIESSSLPLAEKLKQIEILESLLGEYRGLPREKRDKQAERRLLYKLASFNFLIAKYKKAIEYYEQSLKISSEIKDQIGKVISLSGLGITYENSNNYRKAIDYYEQSLVTLRGIDDLRRESYKAYNFRGIGTAYENLGDIEKAIEFHEQSLVISQKIHDRIGEGFSLGGLGNAYSKLGKYQKAIDLYEQSLTLSREIGDLQSESISLANLGSVYGNLGLYREAIDYHEQSILFSRKIGDKAGEINSLANLGVAYEKLAAYGKAIDYQEYSLAMSRKIGNRFGEGNSLCNLGNIYKILDEKKKACSLWKESLTIFEAIKSPNVNMVRQLIEKNCES